MKTIDIHLDEEKFKRGDRLSSKILDAFAQRDVFFYFTKRMNVPKNSTWYTTDVEFSANAIFSYKSFWKKFEIEGSLMERVHFLVIENENSSVPNKAEITSYLIPTKGTKEKLLDKNIDLDIDFKYYAHNPLDCYTRINLVDGKVSQVELVGRGNYTGSLFIKKENELYNISYDRSLRHSFWERKSFLGLVTQENMLKPYDDLMNVFYNSNKIKFDPNNEEEIRSKTFIKISE